MPSERENLLLSLWSTALTLEVGLSIKSDDRHLLKQQLYRVRKAYGTAEMEDIAICVPKLEGELWLIKKELMERA